MAKDAETSKPKHLDPTSEYYLSSQANSGSSLTKDTLKGDNYVAWEQSAILTLKSHNKLAFIDGRITKPDPESEDFLAWDIVNSTLCKGRGRGRGSPAMSQNAVGSSSGPLQASAAATQNNNPSLSQAQAAATSALQGLTPEHMQRLITFLESSPSATLYCYSGSATLYCYSATVSEFESYELWHRRMGHPSSQPLIHLPTVSVVSPSLKTIFDVCCRAKHSRTVFPDSTSRAMDIFGLVHCDIWGPYRVLTPRSHLRLLHRALLLLRLPLLVVESDKRKLLLFSRTMYVTLLKFIPPASSTPTNGSSGPRYPLSNFVSCKSFSAAHSQFLDAVSSGSEPHSYKTASHDPKWRAAMQAKIDALEANGTWTIEDLPPSKKPIGSKWVYKIKFNSEGSIERYKARVVVRGDTQVEGLDYTETFAPVAKMVSVRVFLAVAVIKNWELHQIDINNAFLHGDLHEEVYIRPPPGFSPSSSNKVLRLRKSLYGLRQSPRNWFAKLSTALRSYGFLQSHADHTLFTYRKGDVFLSVLVYVDDLILAGNNSTACSSFKKYLNDCFKLKDLGPFKYFLGIKAARGTRGLFLSQGKYALDILSESGLSASKPATFPMEQNHGLALAGGPLLSDPGPYWRLIGRLVYLTITRPDICYAVHVLSQFMQSPRSQHWDASLWVLRYLKAAPGQGLFLPADSPLQIYAFYDSDWASCPLTRRSVTGYFVSLENSPISWRTKKQQTVSRSSAKAEYRSMAVTTCELTWLKFFLLSLGIHHDRPMRLFCDNQAALHIASNPVFHERTKHIQIDCHYVKEQLLAGNISTAHVRTAQQVTDIFTKALGRHQFHYLCGKLGIQNLLAPT
ncbi:hypothetical protein RJ639_017277 [Escallonia herrerae]|uniref:Retrovirus-related Pol polyprotein from transposon RE2 n=1 Tax=Escallonia herrerae TaxID=1293975 RepID=A0AA88VBV2_9ASTE|nr:hypothetical protein RJ639_017277 [Escallonia herrerae]